MAKQIQTPEVSNEISYGELDIIGPDYNNESIAKLFRDSVCIMKNVGHFPMLENEPDTLAQVRLFSNGLKR